MTIEQLIEKLKKENEAHRSISYIYDKFMTKNHEMEDFDFLHGFIYGLLAARYISKEERDELMDELLNSQLD